MRKQLAILLGCMAVSTAALAATDMKLLDMVDKLDQLDRNEFDFQLGKANECTRSRDFDCAQQWLAKAGKLAKGERDRQKLQLASRQLDNEKQTVSDERRQREENEQRLALQQEEEARQRRRAREDDNDSGSTMTGLAAIIGMASNNYAAQMAQRRAQPLPSLLAKVETFPAVRSAPSRAPTLPSTAAQRSTPAAAARPTTASPSSPSTNSHLGTGMTQAQLAQVGARAAGISLESSPGSRSSEAARSADLPMAPVASAGTARVAPTGPSAGEEKKLYTYTKDNFILNSPASLFNSEQTAMEDVEQQFKKYSGPNFGGYELQANQHIRTEIISRGNTVCESYRYAGRDAYKCKIPVVVYYVRNTAPDQKDSPGRGVSR